MQFSLVIVASMNFTTRNMLLFFENINMRLPHICIMGGIDETFPRPRFAFYILRYLAIYVFLYTCCAASMWPLDPKQVHISHIWLLRVCVRTNPQQMVKLRDCRPQKHRLANRSERRVLSSTLVDQWQCADAAWVIRGW